MSDKLNFDSVYISIYNNKTKISKSDLKEFFNGSIKKRMQGNCEATGLYNKIWDLIKNLRCISSYTHDTLKSIKDEYKNDDSIVLIVVDKEKNYNIYNYKIFKNK